MRCSTCGEHLAPDQERCPTCGAAVGSATGARRLMPAGGVKRCPRCSYSGQGVGYFTRTGHVAILVGLSVFTYGAGGLAYWLVRRNTRICPNCGLNWTSASSALVRTDGPPWTTGPGGETRDEAPLPSAGIKRRVLGVLLMLFAVFMAAVGAAEEGLLFGSFLGALLGAPGTGMFYWGLKAQAERRDALTKGLQRRVLRLATRRGGTLTVTEVAAQLDLSMETAEKVLIAMDDGFRVRSDITDEGILLYEFPEVQHRGRLETG